MARKAGKASRSWKRRILVGAGIGLALVVGLWIAIHKIVWLGPFLADTARAVVGPDAVAKLEDTAYAIQDRVLRTVRKNDKPEAYWEVPPEALEEQPTAEPTETVRAGADAAPTFRPRTVGPQLASWSAPGDGHWVPIQITGKPEANAAMYKTLLHPDRNRSWAAVSIVAVDLGRVDLHLMAGRHEPESKEKEAATYARPAVVPEGERKNLLAAFNGGFKTEHGNHGMKIDGVTLVKPRGDSCTVVKYEDGSFAIRTWKDIAPTESSMAWWRQTPRCMEELGQMHLGLTLDGNTYWGATLEGSTVIRRSAVGLSEDGKVLYVGIGDSTTAGAIARAMKHAGAHSIAQLDVNWSFPKFLLYEPKEPGSSELVAKPLCQGFEFTDDEYLGRRSQRDFFYLTLRDGSKTATR